MVKKSSFLDKIVGRFRADSVKVQSSGRRGNGHSTSRTGEAAEPVEVKSERQAAPVAKPIPEEIIPRSKRKLSHQEDAALAMNDSFGEMQSLLRGVQVRMEGQGGRLDEMGRDLSKLPAAADAQLSVLNQLVSQLEKQNNMNAQMVETFSDLPEVMQGVKDSLSRSANSDERTASTLDEFKSTMDRIHNSMGDMVDTNRVHADAASSMASSQRDTVEQLEASTTEGLKALRWAQEDQANRMVKLVGENGKWNRAIVVLMIMSFAALISIFAALITQ